MARSYKHPNSKEIFHARRRARPDQEEIDINAIEFCEACGNELEFEEKGMGICAQCEYDAESFEHDLDPDDSQFDRLDDPNYSE